VKRSHRSWSLESQELPSLKGWESDILDPTAVTLVARTKDLSTQSPQEGQNSRRCCLLQFAAVHCCWKLRITKTTKGPGLLALKSFSWPDVSEGSSCLGASVCVISLGDASARQQSTSEIRPSLPPTCPSQSCRGRAERGMQSCSSATPAAQHGFPPQSSPSGLGVSFAFEWKTWWRLCHSGTCVMVGLLQVLDFVAEAL
jgi:hypothetical protein